MSEPIGMDPGDPSLATRASRSAAVTLAGQLSRVGIQAVGVIVMARLLAPSDFGLIAMAIAVIGAGEVMRDFGLGMAAVQAPTLSVQQRSNLFWLNAAIGLAMALIAFVAAWPVAMAYGDPRVTAPMQLLAVTLLLNGLASQYRAHLQRRLSFGWLAATEVVSLSVGVGTGIVMGVLGYGFWAIVGQQLSQMTIALVIVVAASGWLPGRFDRHEPMGRLVRFGWEVMGYELLTYSSKHVDSIVIGARYGAAPLGFYNRAFQLLTVPLNQIASPLIRVAVSVLSRFHDDPARFTRYLHAGQATLLSFMLAVLFGLCALAEPVVGIVLGPDWSPSVRLFQILSIAGIFQTAGYPILWAFVSLGLTRANLRYSLVARPLIIVMVVAGSFFSVQAVAWAYAIGTALSWPLALIWLSRVSDVRVDLLARQALRSMVGFAVAGASAFAVAQWRPGDSDLLTCAVGGLCLLATVGALFLVWPKFRADLKTAFVVVDRLRHRS